MKLVSHLPAMSHWLEARLVVGVLHLAVMKLVVCVFCLNVIKLISCWCVTYHCH